MYKLVQENFRGKKMTNIIRDEMNNLNKFNKIKFISSTINV